MHRICLNQVDLPAPLSRCPYVRSIAETPACVRAADEASGELAISAAPFVVGLSHQTAHVGLRERFFGEQVDQMLEDLLALGLAEAVVLFTCNRIEIYGVGGEHAVEAMLAHLAMRSGLATEELRAHLYVAKDLDAAGHLMRVAAGLESMVVGEPQILGQVAQALSRARAAKAAGPQLTRLFEAAIRAGRRARQESGVGRRAASISDAAVAFAKRQRPDLAALGVLVIGAGQMASLAVKALLAQKAQAVTVVSRSDDRAAALADRLGTAAKPFSGLRDAIAAADVIIAATGATVPIVHARDVPGDGRRRLMIDLAVPRNVAPEVAEVAGVELCGIDDLKPAAGQHRRRGDADARSIIGEHLKAYRSDSAGREMGSMISALRQRVEALVDAEIRHAIRRLPRLDEESRVQIEQMRRRIASKLLHSPTMALKSHQSPQVAQLVSELFDLDLAGGPKPRGAPASGQPASAVGERPEQGIGHG